MMIKNDIFGFQLLHTDTLGVIVTLTEDSRVSKHSYKKYFTGSGDVTTWGAGI